MKSAEHDENSGETPTANYHLVGPEVQELSETTYRELLTCLQILEANGGCTTPFEDFFSSLISLYEVMTDEGLPVSPDMAQTKLEEFEREYQDAMDIARRFAKAEAERAEREEAA